MDISFQFAEITVFIKSNYFMKNYVVLFAVSLITLFFVSCSDDSDNPLTPITPVGKVLLSFDTLGVVVSVPNSSNLQRISFTKAIQASKVRVEYRIQSNGDTSHCIARYLDTTSGTPSRPGEQLVYNSIDSQYNYLLEIPTQPFYIGFMLRLFTLPSASIPYYIRFVNIKVTKVE